jgi:hypothetical protein
MAESVQAMNAAVDWMERATRADPGNQRWRIESLHTQGGLLLAQLDSGLAGRRRPATPAATIGAAQRGRGGQGPALAPGIGTHGRRRSRAGGSARGRRNTLAKAQGTRQQLSELLHSRPHNWQGRELQARLGLLAIRASAELGGGARGSPPAARPSKELQPAVDSGQAGFVLEAWLAARACSGSGTIDAQWLQRLTAGGYRPSSSDILSAINPRRKS